MTDQDMAVLEPEIQEENDPDSDFLDAAMKPLNPADIDIVVEPKSLDSLIERITHQEIDMNTDFQRHAELWDNQKMSRLIESILIRFPLPAFYFDASEDDNWLIVDGLQRLSAIKKFVIDKKLRLSGLEFLTELNGKNYESLHRTYQRRIKECPVTVYMIKPGTPLEVKYSVFRRINTGGMTLNNQEIRNAMAKPPERKILEKLASDPRMLALMGDFSKRMIDQELVLRFWAFYRFDYLDEKNKKSIAQFLDRAMDDIKTAGLKGHQELVAAFDNAIGRCSVLLGEKAFEKVRGGINKTRKNSALFEVWMSILGKLAPAQFDNLLANKVQFNTKVDALLADQDFLNAITYSTQKADHVKIRYQKINQLISEVVDD